MSGTYAPILGENYIFLNVKQGNIKNKPRFFKTTYFTNRNKIKIANDLSARITWFKCYKTEVKNQIFCSKIGVFLYKPYLPITIKISIVL